MALDARKKGIAVICVVCSQRKAPVGRSVPFVMSLCDHECSGYHTDPLPGSLWPGESEAEFGYSVSDAGTEIVPQCDCIASGNPDKPKQHGADPHAKNCAVYQRPSPSRRRS